MPTLYDIFCTLFPGSCPNTVMDVDYEDITEQKETERRQAAQKLLADKTKLENHGQAQHPGKLPEE